MLDGWTKEWMRLTRNHSLYCKGRVLGHKRAKRNTRPNTSLLQIEGVATKEDAQFYLGKVRRNLDFGGISKSHTGPLSQRVAYVYKAKREIAGSKVRVIWGCVHWNLGDLGRLG